MKFRNYEKITIDRLDRISDDHALTQYLRFICFVIVVVIVAIAIDISFVFLSFRTCM